MTKAQLKNHVAALTIMVAILVASAIPELVVLYRQARHAPVVCPAPPYNVQEKLYHWDRATTLEGQGDLAGAIAEYRKTLCVDPSDDDVREALKYDSEKLEGVKK